MLTFSILYRLDTWMDGMADPACEIQILMVL